MTEQNQSLTPAAEAQLIAQQNLAARMEQAFSDEQRQVTQLIGERIGRRSMAQMLSKLLTVTDLLDLQRIKESKQYKGFVHVDENGKSESITTWADYCRHVEGRSVEAVDVDLNNLKKLGPDLFDSMRRIGIGPGTMRDIRQLPEDDKAVIAEVVKTDNKDEIVDLIDSLTAKHAKEKAAARQEVEALTRQVEEVKANLEAKERNMADKNAKIDKQAEDIAKMQRRIVEMPPADVGIQMRQEATLMFGKAQVGVRALKSALTALSLHTTEHGISHADFLSGQMATLQRELDQLRSEFDIKAAPDGDDTPDWLRPGALEAANAQMAADMAANGWKYDAAGNMVRIDEDQLNLLDSVEA